MLERLRHHLDQRELIPPGSRVLVGVSGGADSICLLHLLHRLEINVVAAHLHHGMRPEADAEQAKVEEFCANLGVECIIEGASVPDYAIRAKVGLEEAGRTLRYRFFARAAYQAGCHLVATAHTKDDQVETVLFNLIRGSGLAGVAGIPESRDGVIRPLLPFTQSETRAYCLEELLWYHDDPANADINFHRSRLRHRVLPELAAINPAFREKVAEFASIAAVEDEFLNGMAAAALERAELPLNCPLHFLTKDVEVGLDRAIMRSLPPVLVARGLRLVARVLRARLDYNQTTRMTEAIYGPGPGSITTERGRVEIAWNDRMVHARIRNPDVPTRFLMESHGATESEAFGWRITCEPIPVPTTFSGLDRLEATLDPDTLVGNLYGRPAQAEESFVPLGRTQSKKIARLFQEQKLTSAARRRLPIICDTGGPVWLPGGTIADRVKITAASNRAIRLRFEPLEGPGRHNTTERSATR